MVSALAFICGLACGNSKVGDSQAGATETGGSETETAGNSNGEGNTGEAEGDGDGDGDPGDGDAGDGDGPYCGNGNVDPGEACDDGNQIDTDACTVTCALNICGDGIEYEGVEACDDGNAIDGDGCAADCTLEICGDGKVDSGEACDDGNLLDNDACTSACVLAQCGDGFLYEETEECDDGNVDPSDGCSADCAEEWKYVFVSSSLHTGNLGGYDGANDICNTLADDAGLPGTYKAWLSDNGGTPLSRMLHSALPYVLVDNTPIAANWAGVIDGTLSVALGLTETGGPAPIGSVPVGPIPTVWTNTAANGTLDGANTSCDDWTSEDVNGAFGRADVTDATWTLWMSSGCNETSAIYCFQQ